MINRFKLLLNTQTLSVGGIHRVVLAFKPSAFDKASSLLVLCPTASLRPLKRLLQALMNLDTSVAHLNL